MDCSNLFCEDQDATDGPNSQCRFVFPLNVTNTTYLLFQNGWDRIFPKGKRWYTKSFSHGVPMGVGFVDFFNESHHQW